MTDISSNPTIKSITRQSCFKIKQIIEELEKKIEIRYNIPPPTVDPTSRAPAGVAGSIIDNSYRNWTGSLRG